MNSWLFTRWVTLLGVTASLGSRWARRVCRAAHVPAPAFGIPFKYLKYCNSSQISRLFNEFVRVQKGGLAQCWVCSKKVQVLVLIPEQAIRFLMLSQGRIVHAFSWVVKKLCCYIQAYESIEALSKVIRLKFHGAGKKKKKRMVLKLLILNGKCIFVTLEFSIATLTALWKYVAAPKKQQNFNI